MLHCSDNAADRMVGMFWETQFCELAGRFGLCFSPLQIGRANSAQGYTIPQGSTTWNPFTLPDITIWTAPGQHHEIKHKAPTAGGYIGLEVYRFEALRFFAAETQQDVFYTIHDHSKSGGRDAKQNRLEDWFTANVKDLVGKQHHTYPGTSWIAGKKVEGVDIHYWHISLWRPLEFCLRLPTPPARAAGA